MKAWLLATRPKTLTAAFVPVLAGTALAFAQRSSDILWSVSFLTLLSAVLIQVGTNFANDAIDFKKGADTEKRIGPVRVTQSGLLTAEQVMFGAFACFLLAMMAAVPLVMAGGWVIVAIGLVSLFLGYGYTGGPFPLAYLGLGDLFVLLFFGLIAVSGTYYLQLGRFDLPTLILGTQIGLHATVLIAVNNLRDHRGDKLVNKKTLAVRWGVRAVRIEIALLCFLPFVLNGYWLMRGWLWASALPLLALPLAWKVANNVFRTEPSAAYNQFLGQAAGLHLLFGILWSVGAFLL